MKSRELLQRLEQLYEQLEEECFTYLETIVSEDAQIQPALLVELSELLDELAEDESYDEQFVCSIMDTIDHTGPIYQFSMLKPISIEGHEDKIDLLYEEKLRVEQVLLGVYNRQRRVLLKKATPSLRKLSEQLQNLLRVGSMQ
ncbi:hypothetical protein [Metabacillus iocasae]|uniref:Uncharacterized protein n=1 Tax=Priestia iocasae TaxID=2291674 RepID=A0ABS2QSM9_9BACI|nr:hypothetical protein [Metabacillus iocasae]MBM7702437.1 hypothetical protein [Metabacillus iocasae]